ncbi:putative SUR7 family protein FMP45 [Coleophoma crateriformis]|uniref:Putative SUR7 family protein FMP45 n=1 Tax=Coleophoma crateriformis TaxID=565419 RepID=A0A3D8QIC5_9HELO|nr:putative SUR7 family protein FMP45 [Coleophoma crateriformis]
MAPGIRAGAGIASMILIAGSIVLLFFVVLSGVKNTTPLNKTWFLQADSGFGATGRSVSQWTYFYICGANNQNCGKPVPDLPVGYAWQADSTGVPSQLLGKHAKGTTGTYYFYMWRFGWVFYLMALVFDVLAFFTSLLAPVSRLAAGVSGFVLCIALFWMSLAASLMTVTFVKMRDQLNRAGINSHIGQYAFGFTWGAWAAMFLSVILLFLGCGLGGSRKEHAAPTTNRAFFRRQRSRRSARGSFVDNDSSRRVVKEEYS